MRLLCLSSARRFGSYLPLFVFVCQILLIEENVVRSYLTLEVISGGKFFVHFGFYSDFGAHYETIRPGAIN